MVPSRKVCCMWPQPMGKHKGKHWWWIFWCIFWWIFFLYRIDDFTTKKNPPKNPQKNPPSMQEAITLKRGFCLSTCEISCFGMVKKKRLVVKKKRQMVKNPQNEMVKFQNREKWKVLMLSCLGSKFWCRQLLLVLIEAQSDCSPQPPICSWDQ